MRQLLSPVLLAAALLLSACASAPRTGSGPGAAPVQEAAPARTAPAVAIPAGAARKLVLTMTGPDHVVQAKDWPEFKREWRETFADHAKEAGVAYSFSDAPPGPSAEDGTLLTVHVADYRLVGIGARIMFGIMTGNAFIDAKARYTSLRDGALYGEQPYNTSSSAWGGIFAKMTPQQVDAIASQVFLEFKAAGK